MLFNVSKDSPEPLHFYQFNLTSLWCLMVEALGWMLSDAKMIGVSRWVIWRIGESWGSTQDTISEIREVAPVEWSITQSYFWNSVLPDLSVSSRDGWGGWGARYKLLLAGSGTLRTLSMLIISWELLQYTRGSYEYFIGFTPEENVIALRARIWKNYGLPGAEE